MAQKFFITGTDTDIGKTYVSVRLLKLFTQSGYSTLGIKPIATGCDEINTYLYNQDALLLSKASSIKLDYQFINPIAFKKPIAPHIGALKNNQILSVKLISEKISYALNYPADIYIIEGTGGWAVPLNNHETMADFVKENKLSVILVIGIKLGCLNHAILTYQAIKNSGVNFAGWIANCIDPEALEIPEIINTLKYWIKAPCLGLVPYQASALEIVVSPEENA